MPDDKVIEIILRLRDEVTKGLQQAQVGLHQFSNQVKEIGLDMRKTGREMTFMGTSMLMAGTALTAPLIAAYKEAGKFNADIAHQLNETKNVFQNLSVSIGEALLPVMKEATDQIAKMVNWWENLDGAMREKIITSVFNLGKNLIFLGTTFLIVGKSITFLGNLALLTSALMAMNPVILAAAAAFGVLVVVMLKSKAIADGVLGTFALLTKILTVGLINIDYKKMSAGLDDWKKSFTDVAGLYKNFINQFGGAGWEKMKQPQGDFFSGFKLGLEQTREALASWRDIGLQEATDLFSGMQSNFKTMFVDAFSGQLKKASDYFAAFGNTLINIFADILSKMVEMWISSQLWQLFGLGGSTATIAGMGTVSVAPANYYLSSAATLHEGGLIRAHSGYLASDERPIIVQTGERVLSRSQNRDYEKGSGRGDIYITMNPTGIVKAYDFADFYAHKEEFQAMMAESIDLNKLRKVINANR